MLLKFSILSSSGGVLAAARGIPEWQMQELREAVFAVTEHAVSIANIGATCTSAHANIESAVQPWSIDTA